MAPALAARRRTTTVTFVALDVTFLGADLTPRPYEDRRSALENLGFFGPAWATLPRWPGSDGAALLEVCEKHGVEGLLWKRAGSPYRSGIRSSDWRTMCRHSSRRHRRRPLLTIRG